jgi:hypothetical protein
MKRKGINSLITLCIYLASGPLAAQESDRALRSVNEGALFGIGKYNIRNGYISDSRYTGMGLRMLNERMKLVPGEKPFSSQQMYHVNLAFTQNSSGTISALSGMADYSYGYHYRIQPPVQGLKLLAGASLSGMFGFIYNTQTANNSVVINADVDLNLSVMALYSFQVKNYPLTLRYQANSAIAGLLFTPGYGQSYYEIFGLGNWSRIVSVSSLHNKFTMRNYFTVDFPVGNITVRAGYLNCLYYTNIHNNRTHRVSHNLMVGFVKEFISFSGKRLNKKHLYQSAYY